MKSETYIGFLQTIMVDMIKLNPEHRDINRIVKVINYIKRLEKENRKQKKENNKQAEWIAKWTWGNIDDLP